MRGTALSFSSTFGRLGAIAAPLLLYLTPPSTPDDSILTRLPLAAYGVFMILAAVSCLWLWPETTWTAIPDSLEEGEAAASSHNPWISCCYCKSSSSLKLKVEEKDAKESENMLDNNS